MTNFGFEAFVRRALFAAAAVSVVPAAAQEGEVAQPDDGVNLATEKVVNQDSIDFYQIRAGESEYLPGRLRVADSREGEVRAVGTTGVLIIQDGRIVARAETDIGGVAQIRNLRPGGYSVIAIGPEGMGVFGIEVLPAATGVAVPTYRFDSMLVPAADMAVAQQVIAGAMGGAPAAAPTPDSAPPALVPLPASSTNQEEPLISPAPLELQADAADGIDAAAPVKGDIVAVPADGRLVNQFVSVDSAGRTAPLANTRVLFLRDGRLLGTIETNGDGYCAATGVDDGVYSLVGVGPSGFFAFGAQMQTAAGAATAGASEAATVFVSTLQGGIPTVHLRAAGAGPDALPFVPGLGGPGPFAPFGPGGPGMFPGGGGAFGGGGGGFAGGGGGFGGGGLLGALLGAGLGAGLGAALADDDNDDDGQVQATPNSP